MKILIAEDDLTSRAVLAGVLKKSGHDVVEAIDGSEALAVFQETDPPRLAILDWMMPRLDGIEVLRRVRACQKELSPYIIMLTTRDDKADIVAGLEAGADDYLAKPFDAGELAARVEVGRRMLALQERLAGNIEELRLALEQIKTLRGIIPICASCKKIRDDRGYWNQVEDFIRNHTEAEFSHGICPQCMVRLYPEYATECDGAGGTS